VPTTTQHDDLQPWIRVNGTHLCILPLIVDLHDYLYDIILGINWIINMLYFILPAMSTAQPVPIVGEQSTAQTGGAML